MIVTLCEVLKLTNSNRIRKPVERSCAIFYAALALAPDPGKNFYAAPAPNVLLYKSSYS
jgi:hypothetical protein